MYPPRRQIGTKTDPQFSGLSLKPQTESPKGWSNWRLTALSQNGYHQQWVTLCSCDSCDLSLCFLFFHSWILIFTIKSQFFFLYSNMFMNLEYSMTAVHGNDTPWWQWPPQQTNEPWNATKPTLDWLEECDKEIIDVASTFPRCQSDQTSMGCARVSPGPPWTYHSMFMVLF